MKHIVIVSMLSIGLLLVCGCRRHDKGPGLDQFAGSWRATYSLFDPTGGRVTSGTLAVKQSSPDNLAFGEKSSMVTGVGQFGVPRTETKSFDVSLKRDPSSDKYLLGFKVDSETVLQDFPLSYSESNGFSGQGVVTIEGKEQPITASIKKEGSGYVWKVSTGEGSQPKRAYEFQLKERTGD